MKKYDIKKSWLNSSNIIKRSLAIFGYSVLGYLIVLGVFFVVVVILSIIDKL